MRLTIFNTNLYAVVQFILSKAMDVLPEIVDFAKLSPKMLPFILNGPRADIIPQPKLPWTPKKKEGQPSLGPARTGRNSDRADAQGRPNKTGKDTHLSLKPTTPQEEPPAAGVQESKQATDLLDGPTSATLHKDVDGSATSDRPENVDFVSASGPKTPPNSASVGTYEQQPASSVTTVTPQGSSKQTFPAPAGLQFANNGLMSQTVQYGLPTHPQLPFFSQYPFGHGQPQPLSQTIAPSPLYIPQVQPSSMNGGAYLLATQPVQQWGNSPLRYVPQSNPYANTGHPMQQRETYQKVHPSQFNRGVQQPSGHHD